MGSFIIRDGDVFDATEPVIVHQVNCMGVMGSGIAKAIKERYPDHYKYYKKVCSIVDNHKIGDRHVLLGRYFITTHCDRKIAGVFGQYRYSHSGEMCTNPIALERGIRSVCTKYDSIAIPYLIGCGLGGASIGEIEYRLTNITEDMNVTIVAYKLK